MKAPDLYRTPGLGLGTGLDRVRSIPDPFRPAVPGATVGRWTFSAGSGATVSDSTGQSSPFDVSAGEWHPDGNPSPLNGPYVALPAGAAASAAPEGVSHLEVCDVTFAFFFRFPVLPNDWTFILQRDSNPPSTNSVVGVLVNDQHQLALFIPSAPNVIKGGSVTAGEWHSAVAVMSIGGHFLYLDGVLVASDPTPYNPGSEGLNPAPLLINGDARSGVVVPNPTAVDVSSLMMEYKAWFQNDATAFNAWSGLPTAEHEDQRWSRRGVVIAPTLAAEEGSVQEPRRLLSSHDGKWKVFYAGAWGEAASIFMAESPSPVGPFTKRGRVIGRGAGGVAEAILHAEAWDDGDGKIYVFWMTPESMDVNYSVSTDGGLTFSGIAGTIAVESKISAPRQPFGNVAFQVLMDGPSAGTYLMTVECRTQDMAGWSTFALKSNAFPEAPADWVALNGGLPLTGLQPTGSEVGTSSGPHRLVWSPTLGKYTGLYHANARLSLPTCILRCQVSGDLETWGILTAPALAMSDWPTSFDQVADASFGPAPGPTLSVLYAALNNPETASKIMLAVLTGDPGDFPPAP